MSTAPRKASTISDWRIPMLILHSKPAITRARKFWSSIQASSIKLVRNNFGTVVN